jgi:hypothetical protein
MEDGLTNTVLAGKAGQKGRSFTAVNAKQKNREVLKQKFVYLLSFRCVALLYALFLIQHIKAGNDLITTIQHSFLPFAFCKIKNAGKSRHRHSSPSAGSFAFYE